MAEGYDNLFEEIREIRGRMDRLRREREAIRGNLRIVDESDNERESDSSEGYGPAGAPGSRQTRNSVDDLGSIGAPRSRQAHTSLNDTGYRSGVSESPYSRVRFEPTERELLQNSRRRESRVGRLVEQFDDFHNRSRGYGSSDSGNENEIRRLYDEIGRSRSERSREMRGTPMQSRNRVFDELRFDDSYDPNPRYIGHSTPLRDVSNVNMRRQSRSPWRSDSALRSDMGSNDRSLGQYDTSRRRIEKAPKYDGKSDLTDFMVQFEQVAAWNKWTESDKAAQLLISLDGTAKQMLSELTMDKIGNYQSIKQALINRFNPVERETAYRCEFKSKRRQKGESIEDFGYSLRKIALKAYPNVNFSGVETHVIDQFIQGLGNAELKKHVQFHHPQTLDQAISLAVEYESFVGPSDAIRKPSGENSEMSRVSTLALVDDKKSSTLTRADIAEIVREIIRDEIPKLNVRGTRDSSPKAIQSRPPRDNRIGKREIICYYCHEPGHIEPRCPLKEEEVNFVMKKNQEVKDNRLN